MLIDALGFETHNRMQKYKAADLYIVEEDGHTSSKRTDLCLWSNA